MAFTFYTFIICTSVVIVVLHPCVADRFPPPRNVSYEWIDTFHINVSWQKPAGVDQCNVRYVLNQLRDSKRLTTFHDVGIITTEEMGSTGRNFTIVTTHCDNSCKSWKDSEPLTIPINSQDELVTDFTCLLYTRNTMNCSWKPVKQLQDLKVFYRLCQNSAVNSDKNLTACEDINATRQGCYLKGQIDTTDVCILVNGTYQGRTVQNTFKRTPNQKVKPYPPTLTVTEKGDYLVLSWNQPDISTSVQKRCWGYKVNYTKCNEPTECKKAKDTSMEMPYDDHCLYKIQIKAVFESDCGEGESDLSEVVTYGTTKLPMVMDWSWTVAAIVIPAILSACIILSCYCLRRHKAIICPIVPDPSVIFKEMMMNRSKEPMSTTRNLYIPVLEIVESCKLTALEDGPTSAKLLTDTYICSDAGNATELPLPTDLSQRSNLDIIY